jgi:hypothetical protein
MFLITACGSSSPTGFGLNIHLEAGAIDSSTRSRITRVALHVGGDEPFETSVDVSKYIGAGQVRFRYIPSIRSGTLTLAVDALTADDVVLAAGMSAPIALSGKGIDVPIILGAASVDDMAVAPDLAPLPLGAACGANDQCASSGGCVDGYCCDTACTGACVACNVSGKEGTCSPVGAGFSPQAGHASCGPDPTSTCMRDGACDGAGMCRLYAAGTVCSSSTCSNGMFTPKSVCDASHVCTKPTTIPCAPYICQDATTCYSSCTSTSQCSSPNTCANPGATGSCGLKSLGAPCTADGQCGSAHCAPEGICCTQACTGQCEYCESGTGACKFNVGAPAAPRAACTGQGNAPCGGSCDGSGASCVYPGSSTACGAAANCAQSSLTLHYYGTAPGSCAGGSCQQTVYDCGTYKCGGCVFGGGTWCCYTVCGSDTNCNTSLGYHCNTSNSTCQ